GMRGFRSPGAPLAPRRVEAIVEAAGPLLRGADLAARTDEWVGSRPCTRDGLPLIGATRSPRVFAAGGHGMWGITLGPATGRLLAEQIVTGGRPAELRPCDPLRFRPGRARPGGLGGPGSFGRTAWPGRAGGHGRASDPRRGRARPCAGGQPAPRPPRAG